MIGNLLPQGVVAVEAYEDLLGEPIFPGEQDLVARAGDTRRREFVTARRCARQALGRLGHPSAAILSGPRREPLWPDGVVGAITHCAGYRAAAVALRTHLAGLGIDAEPHDGLPEGVLTSVTLEPERAMLRRLASTQPQVHWDRLLFSAKESVYKVWYPLTGRWLGFEEAQLLVEPANGTFTARLLTQAPRLDGAPPLTELHGRYRVADGLITTAIALPAS